MKTIPQILTSNRLNQLLGQFGRLRAGVIGDIALDAYWHVDMTRSHLSRETPHFPRPVVGETYSPGAGGNVAQNLVALGVGQVSIFSVFGTDTWGERLKTELQRAAICTDAILSHPQRRTVAYIKPILTGYNSQQEDARLDFENIADLSAEMEDELIAALERQLAELDAVLVADQFERYGILTPRVRERLVELAAAQPQTRFLVDSRQRIGLFRHMVIKPNWVEAAATVDSDSRQESWPPMVEIGRKLAAKSARPVFITLSEKGVLVCTADAHEEIAAAPVQPPLDPVGAGDAFMAALAAALAAGADPWEAGAFANLAAGITVEKLNQTGSATPEEIRARYALAVATEHQP